MSVRQVRLGIELTCMQPDIIILVNLSISSGLDCAVHWSPALNGRLGHLSDLLTGSKFIVKHLALALVLFLI